MVEHWSSRGRWLSPVRRAWEVGGGARRMTGEAAMAARLQLF